MSDIINQAKSAAEEFRLEIRPEQVVPYGSGHINDTFLVSCAGKQTRYILQRVNKNVFKRPEEVMENISNVTSYLRKQVVARGGDPKREVLELISAKNGQCFFVDESGEYWRVYLFVENTLTYQFAQTPELFGSSARAFGAFQMLLADYPANELNETIVDFHNTPERYRQLEQSRDNNAAGRLREVGPELEFAFARLRDASALWDKFDNGGLPLRVTHNDTKLNNVLLDEATGRGICVIDLDTVMPGLSAHDFGDSIRFGASTAAEDEPDLSKCSLSLPMFEAYAKGYLEMAGPSLTQGEIESLPMGAKLMTLECGIRFLADYLNGDVYFKIHRPAQNLDRARTQFKLVWDMEQKWDEMHEIISRAAASFAG